MARLNVSDSNWINFESWNNQGVASGPQLTLPDGRIFFDYRMRTDVTHQQALGRIGLNYEGKDVEAQPSELATSMAFPNAGTDTGGPFTTTYAQGDENDSNRVSDAEPGASRISLAGLEIDQFGEAANAVRNGGMLEIAYYYYRKLRYAQAGKAWKCFGTYGWPIWNHWFTDGGGQTTNPSISYFKDNYASQLSAQQTKTVRAYFQGSPWLAPDGKVYTLADLIGANVTFYTDLPNYAEEFYSRLHQMEILKLGQGSNKGPGGCVFFPWYNLENKNNSEFHVGFWFQRRLSSPAGTLRTSEHPQIDFSFALGCNFIIGFCKGDGLVQWDITNNLGNSAGQSGFGTDLNHAFPSQPPPSSYEAQWIPDNAGTPAPNYTPYYPNRPLTWHDAAFVAAEMYSKCSRTAGVSWTYQRFQVNGGNWIDPKPDGSDVLFAASANSGALCLTTLGARPGRGIVLGRQKDGAFDYCIFDPSLGRESFETYTVEVVRNSVTYQFTQIVQGGTLCVCTENLQQSS